MGLLGRKKPKQDAQLGWLNKVDAAYQRAFQVKNVACLSEYLTRTCLMLMMEKVRLGEKAYSGLDRYRHVNWVKGEVTPDKVCWTKMVTYDQIKMSHGIVVPVGDENNEVWVVVQENGQNKVAEIRRV